MQFQQIYGEVGSNFTTASLGRVKLAVNAAYHEWIAARQWSWREITIASIALSLGTAKYTLAGTTPVVTDFDGLISVGLEMNTGGEVRPLVEMPQADFDRVFGHVKTNSDPAVYCVRGGAAAANSGAMISGGQQQLHIAPPPIFTADHGQALQISYFRSAASAELTADSDVPILPVQYHYALVAGGNAYMAEAMGNRERSAIFREIFEKRMAEAIVSDQGLRMRDRQLLTFAAGASIYPITGQNEQTFDLATRPYDRREG
jgi:hypothetical protein